MYCWPTATPLLLLTLLLLPRPLLLLLPAPAAAIAAAANTSRPLLPWRCCNCCLGQSRKLAYLRLPQRFKWLSKP